MAVTHLLERAERRQGFKAGDTLTRAPHPTKCSRLATIRVRERATQHRGEECQ